MPEPVLLSDCKVWLGGLDLSGALNKVSLDAKKAELANGRFGDTADVKSHGLSQPAADISGFWSAGVGEPDPTLFARIDAAVTQLAWPLSFAPPYSPSAAAGAAGNLVYTLVGDQFAYNLGGQHGQNLAFSVKTKPATLYALYRQMVEQAKGLVTATTTSVGHLLGALAATEQLVAVLHVFAITGGSWVLTIESDDNAGFTSATVRATFTAVTTAPDRAVKLIPGAVADTYWRAVLTKTGGTNITFAVALGIANLS